MEEEVEGLSERSSYENHIGLQPKIFRADIRPMEV
jgi:hypothetical protein